MKKVSTLILVFLIAFQFTSCKSDKKEEKKEATKKEEVSHAAFNVSKATNLVEWTAYKTTEKIPVKGKFKKVNITSGGEGNTIKEAINNTEFDIPVSSLFSNDSSRDFKLKKFFFGAMENTRLLSGKLVIEDDAKGYASITMNGVTQKLPFTYTINGKEFMMSTSMDVLNWNAKSAVDSLHEECKELHKGADGVSKTWSEVAINISTTFK
ncbi:MAG: YceI family protein [Flavobacteriaceae bacterium]|nr:YceI family protein [Flavobacteriaceae bacterium]